MRLPSLHHKSNNKLTRKKKVIQIYEQLIQEWTESIALRLKNNFVHGWSGHEWQIKLVTLLG